MNTRRISLELPLLLGLGEFLDNPVALEARDVVDEENAIQVVDLMLQAGGEKARGVNLLGLALAVEIAGIHLRWAAHHVVIFGDRQAAFPISAPCPAGPG